MKQSSGHIKYSLKFIHSFGKQIDQMPSQKWSLGMTEPILAWNKRKSSQSSHDMKPTFNRFNRSHKYLIKYNANLVA